MSTFMSASDLADPEWLMAGMMNPVRPRLREVLNAAYAGYQGPEAAQVARFNELTLHEQRALTVTAVSQWKGKLPELWERFGQFGVGPRYFPQTEKRLFKTLNGTFTAETPVTVPSAFAVAADPAGMMEAERLVAIWAPEGLRRFVWLALNPAEVTDYCMKLARNFPDERRRPSETITVVRDLTALGYGIHCLVNGTAYMMMSDIWVA